MTTVNLGNMVAEVTGEGFPIVMVHGLGGTSNTFQPQMQALTNYRVIRLDLPGAGRSPVPQEDLSIEKLVEAVTGAAKTLEVVRAEWQRMHDSGVTQDELNDAKTYITGSYPLQFTSSSAIANVLLGIQLEDLGIDYIDRRDKLIADVTASEVNKVAKTLLTPDKLTVVVVGKPDGIVSKP